MARKCKRNGRQDRNESGFALMSILGVTNPLGESFGPAFLSGGENGLESMDGIALAEPLNRASRTVAWHDGRKESVGV